MTEVAAAMIAFLAMCVAWVAIGRRRTVRVVRLQRDERAA